MMKQKLLLILFLLPLMLAALECSQCGKRIYGSYVKSSKAVFCSRRCFRKTLPRCAACQGACEKSVLTFMGKTFCSKECMGEVFQCAVCRQGLTSSVTVTSPAGEKMMVCRKCSRLPGCYYCVLPTAAVPEPDGRRICQSCRQKAVVNPHEVLRIFQTVRRDLAARFGYDAKHQIRLHIVDAAKLKELSKSVYSPSGGRRMALMTYYKEVMERRRFSGKRERFISSESCCIYVLDTIPRAMLFDTFAHELTHDHLRHNVGDVKDLASEEGFCELAASLYNEQVGNRQLNRIKEVNHDPVYGGGYRKMRNIYQKTGSLRRTMSYVR